MTQTIINALFGGLLIGVAVSLMLLFNGRVTGISGIVNGLITPQKGDTVWRVFFVLGLLLGGLILSILMPGSLINTLPTSNGMIFFAGLLVGFGTVMGSGCTSGHGICGFSRLSPRSFIATIVFISAGILAVYLIKKIGG